MELKIANTKKDKKAFIRFIYTLYRDDAAFCDMNVTFVRTFLYGLDSYVKRQEVIPILVEDHGRIKAECIFVIDETDEIKLSFLEFMEDAEPAVRMLEQYARQLMRSRNKRKTVVGINGQISYGLGILTKETNRDFEFNSNYQKDYYARILDGIFPIRKRAFSYRYDAEHSLSLLDADAVACVSSEYTFRYLDKIHFKKDMMIFGALCHESLKNTPCYSEKKPFEMYELMKPLRLLMRKEDIIFALKDGKEVGFVYTHPDYAELFDRPRLRYIRFYLRFLRQKPKNVIYNVIGVRPEHQSSGIAVALIYKSILMRKTQFPRGVSSFILEDNIPSTQLCRKLSTGIHKEFRLYEIRSEDDV